MSTEGEENTISEWDKSWKDWYDYLFEWTANKYHEKYNAAIEHVFRSWNRELEGVYPINMSFYSEYENICVTYENTTIKIEKKMDVKITDNKNALFVRFTLQCGKGKMVEWKEIHLYIYEHDGYENDTSENIVYSNDKFYIVEKACSW